jgi:hypothetical protein
MKRVTLTLLLSLLSLSSIPAMAQRYNTSVRTPAFQPYAAVGVRGGLSVAGEDITPPFSEFTLGSRTGFILGGQLDYWFAPAWALSVQALYDQKGASLTSGNAASAQTETDELNLAYLEVPILAKVALGSSDFRPYLFAGPSFGFLLSANTHQTVTQYGVVTTDQTADETNTFQTIDASLLFGAGVSYQLTGGPQLMLDAGYALGLVNVEKNANTGTAETIGSRDIRVAAAAMWPIQ